MRFGDLDTIPMALATSKLDRIAFISNVNAGSTSVYFYDNTVTSDMMIVSHWDSYLNDVSCPQFAFSTANSFASTNLLLTATPANLPKYKTAAYTAYGVFDVNGLASDSSSSNTKVDMTNMYLKDLGTQCTTNGQRMYVPL